VEECNNLSLAPSCGEWQKLPGTSKAYEPYLSTHFDLTKWVKKYSCVEKKRMTSLTIMASKTIVY